MSSAEFCKAMIAFALTFPELKSYQQLDLDTFTNGLPFCHMLADSKIIEISADDLDQKGGKWINKVANLKKILSKIRPFFQKRILGVEKIEEIDVVEIAKHNSPEQLIKYFEVVLTVLLSSPSKQRYIQSIMDLDLSVQKTFMELIKLTNTQQDSLPHESSTILELEEQMKELRRENADLKSEISQLTRKNKHLQREVKQLRDKLIDCQEQMQLRKTNDHSLASDDFQFQIDKQKILIDNLKIKLLNTVRESELQISHLKEEISSLNLKSQNMSEIQSTLEQYKDLYNQAISQLQKMNNIQKERRKLVKIIQDKDQFIKKLQTRFEQEKQLKQENQSGKINQTDKKSKLEKEFKRLKSQPSEIVCKFNSDFEFMEDQKDQINYLEEELNKATLKIKDFQKENLKNRKKLDKLEDLEKEKKRLERVVAELNKAKDAEIEFLVTSLYDLREENIKMFELLKEGKSLKKKENK